MKRPSLRTVPGSMLPMAPGAMALCRSSTSRNCSVAARHAQLSPGLRTSCRRRSDGLTCPNFGVDTPAWPVIGIDVPEHAKFNQASPRDFVVLVSESFANACQEDAHDMVFIVDITDETRPFPVGELSGARVGGRLLPTGRALWRALAQLVLQSRLLHKADRGVLFQRRGPERSIFGIPFTRSKWVFSFLP